MYFYQYVAQKLAEDGTPLLSEYELFLTMFHAYSEQRTNAGAVRNPPKKFDHPVFRRVVRQLRIKRRIVEDPDFRGEVWQILAAPPAATAEDAICLIDPFARVAYLSAFERYSLTNRSPKSLQILTLSSPEWGKRRRELIQDNLPPQLIGREFPSPVHVSHREYVRRRMINAHTSKYLGESMKIRGTYARISTIGQAFVDSLEQPIHCGGMRHVLEIWQEHAKRFVGEIVSTIQQASTSPIVKVRAGYILTEYLGINEPTAESWVDLAQRGSSRKLDPNKPFASSFSEKWMLSLNV